MTRSASVGAKVQLGSAAEAEPLNPAAGSRDEPTRLHVEFPIEAQRYKYTKALFFESNNLVQALPPNFCLNRPCGSYLSCLPTRRPKE